VLYQVDASVDRAGEVPDARWDLAVLADLPAADEPPRRSGRAEHDGDVVTRACVHVDEVGASEAPNTLPASCEVAGGQRPPVVGALERDGQRRRVPGGCGPGEIWLIRETLPAVIRKPFPLETTVHTAPIGLVANSSRAIGMHANGPTCGSGLLPKRLLYTSPWAAAA